MLDEFEGDGYRRILAKYEMENGEVGVGYMLSKKRTYSFLFYSPCCNHFSIRAGRFKKVCNYIFFGIVLQ
jgi:hypothetical protein